MVCASFVGRFLLIYFPFSRPILGRIPYRFSSIVAFLLFRRTLGDTHSTGEFVWFSYMHLFQKTRFFMRSNSENNRKTCMSSHHLYSIFKTCSVSMSVSICSSILDGKMVSKMGQTNSERGTLFATFKCLNITNQWTDRTRIFIVFIISYFFTLRKVLK